MRNHIVDEITRMAENDSRMMFVIADLGFNVVEEFQHKFPDRFINVGIAEQNMTAVAAGIALEGNMVFTYSIGNFPTLRCIEQIRNDVCYHNANVKVLAVGGGFSYGDLGMTHHATEDIAMMRALPNMRVYVPADAVDAVECLRDACSFDGPAYIRLARGKEKVFHEEHRTIDITKVVPFSEAGEKVNILTTGTILNEGKKLCSLLNADGISTGVFSIPRIKPIDIDGVQQLAKKCELLITIEEHNVIGGLGGAIAEILSEIRGQHASLYRAGLRDTYTNVVGDQNYLREHYGMSAGKIFAYIKEKYAWL